jgi:phage shock protein PspC (stress-responsive transcriptional regulator)
MTSSKLTRSRDDRWIGGVCGGLAELSGVDATLIRVVLVVATILGAGSLIVIYLICWLLIPNGPELPTATPPAPEPPSSSSQ